MSRKTKVELSIHYDEIMDMIKEGFSSRDISDYLKDEYDEKIAHGTINNYAKKIRSKIKQEYHKRKNENKSKSPVEEKRDREEIFDEVVDKGVSDLNAIDNIINEADELNLNINNIQPVYMENYCVNSEVEIERLKIQVKRLAIQAVNTKAKILKDDSETNVNINIDHKLDSSHKIVMQPEFVELSKALLKKANHENNNR